MGYFITKWFYSTNHKHIGILYIYLGLFAGIISLIMSLIIRLELSMPGDQILSGDYQLYNVLVTAHGLIMLFFVVLPIASGVLVTISFH